MLPSSRYSSNGNSPAHHRTILHGRLRMAGHGHQENRPGTEGMNDGRPLVWPYTMFMLFVGSLVSIMFIPGAIDNYRQDNWGGRRTPDLTRNSVHRSPAHDHPTILPFETDWMTPGQGNVGGHHPSSAKPEIADRVEGFDVSPTNLPNRLEKPAAYSKTYGTCGTWTAR